jgi:hypothetical protein
MEWNHNNTSGQDGEVTISIATANASLNKGSVDIQERGEDGAIEVSRSNALTLPAIVEIDATPDAWLLYEAHGVDPFYRVRFIGASGWAGHGETGNVVGGEASLRKNRRLEW